MFINKCNLTNNTGTDIYTPHCYELRRFTLLHTNCNQHAVLLSRKQDFSFKWVFLWQHYSSDNVLSVLIQQLPVARRPRRNKYFILPPNPAIINTLLLHPPYFFTPFPFRLPSLLLFLVLLWRIFGSTQIVHPPHIDPCIRCPNSNLHRNGVMTISKTVERKGISTLNNVGRAKIHKCNAEETVTFPLCLGKLKTKWVVKWHETSLPCAWIHKIYAILWPVPICTLVKTNVKMQFWRRLSSKYLTLERSRSCLRCLRNSPVLNFSVC